MSHRDMPEPIIGPESAPFWSAAAEGRFMLKFCADCGDKFWYPRNHCPYCWSASTHWVPSTGKGIVYTYSVMRRAKVPYVLAYVTLEDGPMVMTHIVDVDVDAVRVGMAVGLTFVPTGDGKAIPVFKPVVDAGAAT